MRALTGARVWGGLALCSQNYLSVGIDAKAALLWTRLSRAMPQLFKLRLLNKLWYIVCGAPELLLHTYGDLHERVELVCDGKPIEIPRSVEGLMILNIPSCAYRRLARVHAPPPKPLCAPGTRARQGAVARRRWSC